MIIDRNRICWVLVSDGVAAHFYTLHPHPFRLEPVSTSLRSDASERHGQIPEHKKARFAREIATAVHNAAAEGLFQELVIVAPPHMLGDLRDTIEPGIRKMVVGDIGAELANLSPTEIAKHLKPRLMPASPT